MIAALCRLYQASKEQTYLDAAKQANRFLWGHLWDGGALHVSFRAGQRGEKGFLDDYAACLFAQLTLYGATLESHIWPGRKHSAGIPSSGFRLPKMEGPISTERNTKP